MAGVEQLQHLPPMRDQLGLHGEVLGRRAGQPLGAVDQPTPAALNGHKRGIAYARLGSTQVLR